jgi:hypothetical protein
MSRVRRTIGLLVATLAVTAAWTAHASAITVSNVTATPADNKAGANSDLSISFDMSGGTPKDLVIHLPPGLVGNPLATKTCSEDQLNANSCPAASKVGTISNAALLLNALPVQASGSIFNVQPRQGEPARFGFVLSTGVPLVAPIILQSPARLRQSDFGLDTVLNDIPNSVSGLPVSIAGVDLTLQGKVGDPPQGFLRNPTSCGTHTLSVDVTPYSGAPGSGSTTFDTVDCQSLPFNPQFSADIKQKGPLTDAVELTTSIKQTIEEAGLRTATVKLPAELGPNLNRFLAACPQADFDGGTCPETARVGNARAESPLQADALAGPVYVVAGPTPSSLPSLGLDLRGPLSLKLTGQLGLEVVDGSPRSSVTFDGLPDIPISDFKLSFDGGKDGLNVASRNPCAKPPFGFDVHFISHAEQTKDSRVQATAGCGPTKGTLKLKRPKKAGAFPVLKLKLKAGAEAIKSAKLKAPKGVSFAKGKTFKKGAKVTGDGKKLKAKASKRTLKLKARGRGASSVKGRFGDGAVLVKGKVRKPFAVVVKDAGGGKTKLKLKAK